MGKGVATIEFIRWLSPLCLILFFFLSLLMHLLHHSLFISLYSCTYNTILYFSLMSSCNWPYSVTSERYNSPITKNPIKQITYFLLMCVYQKFFFFLFLLSLNDSSIFILLPAFPMLAHSLPSVNGCDCPINAYINQSDQRCNLVLILSIKSCQ